MDKELYIIIETGEAGKDKVMLPGHIVEQLKAQTNVPASTAQVSVVPQPGILGAAGGRNDSQQCYKKGARAFYQKFQMAA